MKIEFPFTVLIALVAFGIGFWVSHILGERKIKDFAEGIRLNEVYFVAVDDDTGERISPGVGFQRKGLFDSVILPGVLQMNHPHEFRLNWVDIEGMPGFITASAGGGAYHEIDLGESSWSDRDRAGGALAEPIEIPFTRTKAQPDSDGNAE